MQATPTPSFPIVNGSNGKPQLRDMIQYAILAAAVIGGATLINWRLQSIENRLEKFEMNIVGVRAFEESKRADAAGHADLQHQIDALRMGAQNAASNRHP
jgi:uncharacterized protein (UPF0264 family)